jgi:DNA-directed RNA polymerase specialized sigma24 family protein
MDERRYRASFTDPERNPEEQVVSQQYALYVQEACRKVLTEQQYTVLRLRANGLSYDEIAEVLGTTMTAVKATLYRARITASKAIGINVMTE